MTRISFDLAGDRNGISRHIEDFVLVEIQHERRKLEFIYTECVIGEIVLSERDSDIIVSVLFPLGKGKLPCN